jgi:hypothetical protein
VAGASVADARGARGRAERLTGGGAGDAALYGR